MRSPRWYRRPSHLPWNIASEIHRKAIKICGELSMMYSFQTANAYYSKISYDVWGYGVPRPLSKHLSPLFLSVLSRNCFLHHTQIVVHISRLTSSIEAFYSFHSLLCQPANPRNSEIPPEDIQEKAERLDVNCRIDDGSQVDLEIFPSDKQYRSILQLS